MIIYLIKSIMSVDKSCRTHAGRELFTPTSGAMPKIQIGQSNARGGGGGGDRSCRVRHMNESEI